MVPPTIRLSGIEWDNVVVIDPGHGYGDNTGCVRNLFIEHRFVGRVADMLYDNHDESLYGFNIDMTDPIMSYHERADALIKTGIERPLAIIHLHVDACPTPLARGTWAIQRPSIGQTQLADILTSATYAPRPERSLKRHVRKLTEPIARRAKNVMDAFHQDGQGVRGYEQVLLELGFITNDNDYEYFTRDGAVSLVADCLHAAIAEWHGGLTT